MDTKTTLKNAQNNLTNIYGRVITKQQLLSSLYPVSVKYSQECVTVRQLVSYDLAQLLAAACLCNNNIQ